MPTEKPCSSAKQQTLQCLSTTFRCVYVCVCREHVHGCPAGIVFHHKSSQALREAGSLVRIFLVRSEVASILQLWPVVLHSSNKTVAHCLQAVVGSPCRRMVVRGWPVGLDIAVLHSHILPISQEALQVMVGPGSLTHMVDSRC